MRCCTDSRMCVKWSFSLKEVQPHFLPDAALARELIVLPLHVEEIADFGKVGLLAGIPRSHSATIHRGEVVEMAHTHTHTHNKECFRSVPPPGA